MLVFPNAKINLGLNIIEKRADGYHNIESIFYPIQWCDVLEIIEKDSPEKVHLFTSGLSIKGNSDDNLICKAYRLINRDYDLPSINVYLHKIIPMGAGLGGGSADAAFFIKLLNEKFGLNISWGEMHNYARQLGSDCAFFLVNKPVFAEGKGELLERVELDLTGYFIVLVFPGIFISTPEAYSLIIPKKPEKSLETLISGTPIHEWKNIIKNDFEQPVYTKYPELEKIKNSFYQNGAIYSSMTGSGSAIYGIFKNPVDLQAAFPGKQVWQGML